MPLNPFNRVKKKVEADLLYQMAVQREQANAVLEVERQYRLEEQARADARLRQQHEEHQRRREAQEEEHRRHQEALEQERQFQDQELRRQQEEHRRKLQADQAAYERRWQAEQRARREQEQRMQAEHARLLAAEQERATRLEEERREQERQKQLAREREQQRRENHQKLIRMTSPESLRSLRELIRRKYELDMSIWADRKVRAPLRPDVEVKMEQADAALAEILAIVGTWEDNRNGQWKEHEWRLASEVKMRLEADGKRIWAGNPPWEEG